MSLWTCGPHHAALTRLLKHPVEVGCTRCRATATPPRAWLRACRPTRLFSTSLHPCRVSHGGSRCCRFPLAVRATIVPMVMLGSHVGLRLGCCPPAARVHCAASSSVHRESGHLPGVCGHLTIAIQSVELPFSAYPHTNDRTLLAGIAIMAVSSMHIRRPLRSCTFTALHAVPVLALLLGMARDTVGGCEGPAWPPCTDPPSASQDACMQRVWDSLLRGAQRFSKRRPTVHSGVWDHPPPSPPPPSPSFLLRVLVGVTLLPATFGTCD